MPAILVTSCCLFAAIGSFLFGFDTGIIGVAIAQTNFIDKFGHGQLRDDVAGGIVSSFTGGAIIGSLSVSLVADRYGRRAAIFIGALFACLGGALQGGANAVATIIVGRIITGLGVGLLSSTIPNFCIEVAPPKLRGLLGGAQQWMIGLGIVTSQWVGYGSSLVGGSFSWRFPLSIQVAPALLLVCGIWFLPESPRSLAERGRINEARTILAQLHLKTDKSNQDVVDDELHQIQQEILAERAASQRTTWKAFYQHPALRKRVLIACGIQLFTQTSGVNVIGYYGPRIYAALGYSTTNSLFIIVIYGALALVYNTICLAVVDRVGRRKLLIPSLIGMGATLCVEATLTRFFKPGSSTNINALRASVAMNFVFSVFYTSLGVLSWIVSSEIFPNALRARGTSLSTFTNWSINLVVAQCSPVALTKMGYKYFYLFTAFNWIAALLVYLFFPETQAQSTLESIHDVFGDFKLDEEVNPGADEQSMEVSKKWHNKDPPR